MVTAAAVQLFHVTLGGNFHEVIAGEVYRCGQPTASGLAEMIRRYGIRTVVNLRGDNYEDDWYWDEKRTAEGLGATMVDVGLYGNIPAAADQLRLLVDTLDHARTPILVHCYSGSDRAGMASTLALLLRTDTDVPEARQQLAWWLGHNPFSKAVCHDLMFDRYVEWLQTHGQPHSPDRLRRWVREVYRPELCVPDWANQHRASTH
jgi:protein tyrosine phosphatase (PTP) superfamily phosphohydrolase (DUF442 family)